jgi:hypothetical protein
VKRANTCSYLFSMTWCHNQSVKILFHNMSRERQKVSGPKTASRDVPTKQEVSRISILVSSFLLFNIYNSGKNVVQWKQSCIPVMYLLSRGKPEY